MSSARTGRLGGLADLAGLGGWLLLFNLVALVVWGHGPLVFVGLLAAALGFWAWPSARRRLDRLIESGPEAERLRRRLLVGLLLVVLATQAHQVVLGFDDASGFLVDIALNTDCAVVAWLDGESPWATRCQLWHEVPTMDGVEVAADGTVFLHGWRYHYGYPYFPAMIATYLPMRLVVDGPEAVRWTNLVLVLAHLVLMPLILRRLLPAVDRRLGILVATIAFLGIGRFGRELFEYAVTDIAISFWALCGVLACAHRRFVVGGALLGFASACKLLPGPFLVVPLALALIVRDEHRAAVRLVIGWMVTWTAIVLPALLADPESFLTATILFYQTVHAVGDDTSMWFFLPDSLRNAFSSVGIVLALGVTVIAGLRRDRPVVVAGLEGAFLGYVIFMAFARMTHLNYLIAIFSLGAIALAWATVAPREAPRRAHELDDVPSIDASTR